MVALFLSLKHFFYPRLKKKLWRSVSLAVPKGISFEIFKPFAGWLCLLFLENYSSLLAFYKAMCNRLCSTLFNCFMCRYLKLIMHLIFLLSSPRAKLLTKFSSARSVNNRMKIWKISNTKNGHIRTQWTHRISGSLWQFFSKTPAKFTIFNLAAYICCV